MKMQRLLVLSTCLVLSLQSCIYAAKWECTSSCNVQLISAENGPDRVSGYGTGNTQDKACRAAKKDAVQKAPRGTYARHCQCKCKKK